MVLHMAPMHSLGYNNQHELRHDFFQSFDTTGVGIEIMWCQQHPPMAPLQDNQNEVQQDLLGNVIPSAMALASHDADGIINGSIAFLRSRWLKWDAAWPFLVIWCHWQWHHLIPMATLMVHDTDTSTSTSTHTKCHIVPLNNHLNMTKAMLSLIAPSTLCDRKHVTAMYVPKCNMPHKYQT